MLTIPKNRFRERLDLLPESIRAFAFSLEIGNILRSIAENHHLTSEKSDQVLALTAAVFFGFIHRTDFSREVADSLKLDPKIAESIADEIGKKVFNRIQDELDRFYQPTLASDTRESETVVVASEVEKSELSAPVFLRPRTAPLPTAISPTPPSIGIQNAPFVLHEERSLTADAKKGSMKGFSLPFGLFKSKPSEAATAPKVTVETPKTVHYSEYRSTLTPGDGGEFINLETFGKTSVAPPVPTGAPEKSVSPAQEKTGFVTPINIKKPEAPPSPKPASGQTGAPKVEGNMVDLR